MKHHFADLLDREDNYWTIVPNRERFAYTLDNTTVDEEHVRIITIGKNDPSWQQIFRFKNLEELTLHEPTKEQMSSISKLSQLKRLRITHARPKDIDFIAGLSNLEEVVFEYVSGFSDLSPMSKLENLKSLHLENLRRVNDFSGLRGLNHLRYLRIDGTLDWNQPIEDFTFLEGLPNLEFLSLGFIINNSDYPVFAPLLKLEKLKKIWIGRNRFPTREYAFLETALPNVQGASWELFWEYEGWLEFLGKRAGRAKCNNPTADEKCKEFIQAYEEMKKEAYTLIKELRANKK